MTGDLILKQSPTTIHFDRVYETDMAEGLKAMALQGHGVAFLPHSAVAAELRAGRLVSAVPPEMGSLQTTMEGRAYRECATHLEAHRTPAGKATAGNGKGRSHGNRNSTQSLWDYLLAASAQAPAASPPEP